MFNDVDFEGGCEFTSDFCSNIYSRLYLPGTVIVDNGDNFSELVMIQEGVTTISTRIKNQEGETQLFEFFILPTFSYFGDSLSSGLLTFILSAIYFGLPEVIA